MQEVRIIFSKVDRSKYISHLDINRAMSRALSRANIPLWFTEGFNPHPYMSFSLPLSLGVESECESMNIRIDGNITNEEIKNNLNGVLPTGLQVVNVINDYSDSNDIAYSDYVYTIEFKDVKTAYNRISDLLNREEILAEKKAKKGKRKFIKEVNIRPLVNNYEIKIVDNSVVIEFRLSAGISNNLNPSLLFDTIIKGIDMDFEWKSIKRTKLLKEDFSEFV